MSSELAPGRRLGGYEILASIGQGGMGEVYRARDLKLGRHVALKVLRGEFARDAERLRRFEQEAQAASALNHPNIVHIYAVDQEDDRHYIAMELVEGRTLRELLNEGPIPGEKLFEIAISMASGLAKAHAAGIVHRDLKPENVMVTAEGFVKILDFGLAKLLVVPFEANSDMATLARAGTRHGMLLGTVEYMSPEQAAGKSVDHRSDQFSLGLILYEMATGRIAFRRETAAQTLASIIESEPTPMEEVSPDGPTGLESLVARCLEKSPSDRFEETSEIVDALKALARRPTAAGDEHAPPPPPPRSSIDLGSGIVISLDGVGKEVRGALSQVQRELRQAFGSERYQLRSGNRVRDYSEDRLRRHLRRHRFSGAEMVRREGDDEWMPLYESRLFREEVPFRGDPVDFVAKRRVLELGQHACVFVTFGVVFTLTTGSFPSWMGWWGIGLAAHTFNTMPSLWSLVRRRRALSRGQSRDKDPALLPETAEENVALLSAGFRDEVTRVRALLEKRDDAPELLKEVDLIVERMADLAAKARDLEEQTSDEERRRLVTAEEQAQARAERASSARDRKLFERQLDVVRQRRQAIEKALAVLERLQVRKETTEHQLRQLRLDLSRAEASSAPVPELSSRILDIRHEVDAIDAVDEALAEGLRS